MIAPTTKAPSREHLNPEPMFGLRTWWPLSAEQAAMFRRALTYCISEAEWLASLPLAADDSIVYANDREGG